MAYTYGSVTNCKVRNGQTRTEYQLRLGYEVQSQSIENNTTTVKLRLECRSISSSYTTKGSSGLTSVIDGTTVKSNASVDMSSTNTWQNFGERTITITHNADGSCSVSKSASFTCTAGSSQYSLSSGSASVTIAPATIPRASQPTISASSVTMGSSVTIYTNRVSSSFTHSIYFSFGGISWRTISSGVGTSISWTPPVDLASQIPNGVSGTCTIHCETYNNGTYIGAKTITLTLTVPSSVAPSISSISVSAGNSVVPASWGMYLQGKSQLKVVTNASGSYGSSITSYKVTGIDNNTYWSSNFTSGVLQISGTRTITVTVTDSRGRTATKTTTYTCVAYSNPSITTATVVRCNSDGTENEEGIYLKYSFYGSILSLGGHNGEVIRIGYRVAGSGNYTYKDVSINVSNVVFKDTTFSVDSSYDFIFYVADYFSSSSIVRNIPTGFTLLDFRNTGKGMAVGKVSEKDAFEVGLPTEFNGNVYFKKKSISKALSSPGWYRIAKCDVTGASFIANLHTTHNYTNNSAYVFSFNLTYQQALIHQISGWENTADTITQIRAVKDSADSNYTYIEIYYNKSVLNTIYFDIINYSTDGIYVVNFQSTTSTSSSLYSLKLASGINVSSGNTNQGSWNYPTRGLVTQITDNSGAQHSVIVGLKSDGVTRAYGIDFLDSDSYPTMRLYAGPAYLELANGAMHTNGLLKSEWNGNIVTIGSQNSSWCHIYNSANIPFYFNKDIYVNGYRCLTSSDLTGGVSSLKLGDLYVSGANVAAVGSGASSIYFGSGGEHSGITTNLRGNNVRLYAHSGGAVYLGYSGSTAVTSDENLKDIYEIDDKYLEFFKNLKPITYIYKNVGHRNHMGFGARQVEESLIKAGLSTEEFAGVLKDEDITISADEMGSDEDVHFDELYSLRYEEFIALNTYMIQKQAKQIEEQNNLIADLKARIEILEKQADIC